MYRLHKWLGIAGLVLSIGHWAIAQVPKWFVGWGLLQKLQRGPRPVFPDGSIEHKDEGAHPYTISSAWTGDGRLTFIIKALGDYTQTLPERLKVGEEVTVEGPYGRFDFQGKSHRQIWIGAGIGVTPFIARMKALSQAPDGKQIDLFHPTSVYDARAIELLQRDAAAAGVTLHVLWTQRDGRLTADRLCASVPEWQDADVWFCGPAAFGRSLRADLVKRGLSAKVFHQELFEMR